MSEKTNLTVVIDKEIKHMAKVKAIKLNPYIVQQYL